MKKDQKVLLLLFLTCPISSSLAQVVNTAHFEVHASNQSFSQQTAQILEEGYSKALGYFHKGLPEKVEVYVTDNSEEFDRIVGPYLPDWSLACAIPDQYLIVLKSPDRHHYRKELAEVLQHELAHIFAGDYTNHIRLPTWMNEGFAVWFSEKWGWSEKILVARAVLTGSLLSLHQVDSLFKFQQSKAQLAYSLSFLAISHVEAQYGEGALRKVLDEYVSRRNWDDAFLKTTGLNYAGFLAEFGQMVRQRYNWIGIFSDCLELGTSVYLLFVLLYFIKRNRSKKILKRWEK